MTGRSLRAAIDAKCKSCVYDPGARGNWREQVSACSSGNCPLHPFRPLSSACKRELRSSSGEHRLVTVLRAGCPENGLPAPAFDSPEGVAR
jgi:hypothetical protein